MISGFNAFLLALAAFLFARRFLLTEQEQSVEKTQVEPLVYTTYTPKTLAKYNGLDDPRVLIAIEGTVFDVTAGKKFYGPGGPYENFAGRDASRGLAKNSFDVEMLTDINEPIDTLEDLTEEEKMSLAQWKGHFEGKYTTCGELVGSSNN